MDHFLNYINYELPSTNNIILVDDKFNIFLDGLTLNSMDFTYIGYYEEVTKNAYFCVKRPDIEGNLLYNAWQMYWNNDDITVKIYGIDCNKYYESNEYQTNREYLYKYLMNKLTKKIIINQE